VLAAAAQPGSHSPGPSARDAAVTALTHALRDEDPGVRALAADALGRLEKPEPPRRRVLGFTVSPEVRFGEALTAVSVLITLAALLLGQAKDRGLRRKEFADRVRNAAAATLAKLERLRDISLLKYREAARLFVETSERLVGTQDVGAARDLLWKELANTQAAMAERVLKEDIETAYVGLYPYDVTVYERFAQAITRIKHLDDNAWARFMDAVQDAVLSWHGRMDDYQSALLGNQLRGLSGKYEAEVRGDIDDVIRPNRAFLGAIVSMRDGDIAARRRLSEVTADSARPTSPRQDVRGGGRRRALCVGIDRYARAPLACAVSDAHAWARVLAGLGFTAPVVLVDEDARRHAILDELRRMIGASTAGDVLVFQFAGDGTVFEALDERGRPIADHRVEAICPFDYDDGKVIFSSDMSTLFAEVPDGVALTCFLDCSYQGTTRALALGGDLRGRSPSGNCDGVWRARPLQSQRDTSAPDCARRHDQCPVRGGGAQRGRRRDGDASRTDLRPGDARARDPRPDRYTCRSTAVTARPVVFAITDA
jgi:hypothetical protein